MSLLDQLRAIADEHGARLGVAGVEPFAEVADDISRRVASGAHGGLGFTFHDAATATNPRASWPWCEAIVVVAVPYLERGDGRWPGEGSDVRRGGRPGVARFADGDRYDRVRAVLADVATHLEGLGSRADAVFDDDRLVDRAVAVRAGVAWWGKSTMAITPGFGPWFLIGSVVTDAEIDPTPPMERSCGTCDACIPACPTGAIIAPGFLDARRCLAAVLQQRGSVPDDLRTAVGGRIYGCDECLAACPPGDRALDAQQAGGSLSPQEVLTMTDEALDDSFAHWFVPGRQPRFLRRNALVALGNTGTSSDIHLLAAYASHPDALLRDHARWALGELDEADASSVLATLDAPEVPP